MRSHYIPNDCMWLDHPSQTTGGFIPQALRGDNISQELEPNALEQSTNNAQALPPYNPYFDRVIDFDSFSILNTIPSLDTNLLRYTFLERVYEIRYGPITDRLARFGEAGRSFYEFLNQCRDFAIRLLRKEGTGVIEMELDHTLPLRQVRRVDRATQTVRILLARVDALPLAEILFRGVHLRLYQGREEYQEFLTLGDEVGEVMRRWQEVYERRFGSGVEAEIG